MSQPASAPNRWIIAWAGVLSMLCIGTVYSWSVFTRPLMVGMHWKNETVTWAFAIAIFMFGLGAVVGGRWSDRVGPRIVTVVGIVLYGLMNVAAGLGTVHFGAPWLYATYGIVGGFAGGMAYITPVATVTKWFPDKRGLASSLTVMGFGLGAFVFNQIVARIPGFASAAGHATAYLNAVAAGKAAAKAAGTVFDPASVVSAFSAADLQAVMTVFTISGLVFAVVGGIGASFMSAPPAGYTVAGAVATKAAAGRSYTPGEVLKMPQFYGLWVILFLNVTAGILIISNAVPIYSDLTGASAKDAAAIYGLLAVFNGLGRFFWGSVSDRLGRNAAYTLIFGTQIVIFFALAHLGGSYALVGIAIAIVLACYGGGFGVMPSFNADYFGTKHLGVNYGMIITAWGFGGLVGPLVAAKVKDVTGSFTGALVPVAVMLVAAAVIPSFIKKPGESAAPVAVPRSV